MPIGSWEILLKEEIKKVEELIRSAHGDKARVLLAKLAQSRTLSREDRLSLAALSRRAHEPQLGVKLLYRLIHPSKDAPPSANSAEQIEYAACLIRLGSFQEARQLLEKLSKAPEALFFLAGMEMRLWNYGKAIPLLETYCRSREITDYQTLVGKTNLAVCYYYQRSNQKASVLLGEVLEKTSNDAFKLLHGIALRQLGIVKLNQGDLSESLLFFKKAKESLAASVGVDYFLCEKWEAIAKFLSGKDGSKNKAALLDLRSKAIAISHWESVRDIDFRIAVKENDQSLLLRLYFGSDTEGFKTRVKEHLVEKTLPSTYLWKISTGRGSAKQIDPLSNSEDGLKVGQKVSRLLNALTSDFYRPFSEGELIEKVFPEDFYSPIYSAPKLRQVLLRLRSWLKENKYPITIEIQDGYHRLTSKESVSLVIRQTESTSDELVRLKYVQQQVGGEFTSKDVARILGLSERGARAVLNSASKEASFQKVKRGKNFYYLVQSLETSYKKAG